MVRSRDPECEMKKPIETPNTTKRDAAKRPRELTWWRRWIYTALAPVINGFLIMIWFFYRYEFLENKALWDLADSNQPMVFGIWHEGILTVGRWAWRIGRKGVKATFLISPSVDGELGVKMLARFGGQAVRGSARRSGASALRGLKTAILQNGQSPFIALDGSKGPRHYGKPGALMVARMAGVPLVPVGFAASKSWRLPSWDRHMIPMPFSRVVITVGEPYTVPRKMDEAELESHRLDLENRVHLLMEESEKYLGTAARSSRSHPSDD